jgi:PAS domain S-box-containing protein
MARQDAAAPDEEAVAGAGIVTTENVRACLHPDDEPRVDAEFRAAIASGGLLETEFRVVRSDGVRWIMARGKVVADEAGRPVRMIGVNWDVTERRTAETALREMNETLELRVRERTAQLAASEARHRAFFENAPEYLFLLRATADGALVYDDVNPAAEQLYAAQRGMLLGRSVREVLAPEWGAEIEGYARECILTGRRQQGLVQRSFPTGTARLIDLVIAPVPIPEGHDPLVIASGRDVTESKRAEEQLAHAQRMEAVGQLTGGVAHDFNNLLTVVIGNLDFIKSRARDDEKLWRIADNAQRAAERGARLTAQLLAFARKQRLKPETVQIGRAIGEIRELVRRAVGETIKIRITVTPELWSCHLDAAQFEAAILNLTLNARDAMPNGGTLTVRAANQTLDRERGKSLGLPPGDYVRVVVSDTGTGMSPEVMQRAFEPFFTTKPVGKGTGLGLSQLYGFVSQSGGTVTIDSAFGRGTSVALYLPRAEAGTEAGGAEEPAALAAPDPRPPHAARTAPAVARTVLAVEDEADVLQVIEASLGALGYRVLTARDGAEALRLLERDGQIDLLFTDVVMPNGMSGVELARMAQQLHPGIKVLLTTGYSRDVQDDTEEYDIIDKPYRRDELVARVGAMFEAAAPSRSARAMVT